MTFRPDNAAIEALLSDPDGPVGADLGERADRVYLAAFGDCPRDTTQLANSLGWDVGLTEDGLEARIGVIDANNRRKEPDAPTNSQVCLYVHEGTEHPNEGYVIPANPFLRRNLPAGMG